MRMGKVKVNNQASLVLKISFKEVDFLLMGDVEVNRKDLY